MPLASFLFFFLVFFSLATLAFFSLAAAALAFFSLAALAFFSLARAFLARAWKREERAFTLAIFSLAFFSLAFLSFPRADRRMVKRPSPLETVARLQTTFWVDLDRVFLTRVL